MDILLRTLGPGVHCYLPFRRCSKREVTLNLQDMCKTTVLSCVTLRRLSSALNQLQLPKRMLKYLTELSTTDFEEIECAPFSDAFSLNFFHRALTYRVFCLRDRQEYIVTHGYCPVEEAKIKSYHEEWVKLQHQNVMCICATVTDSLTENVFYVYDLPSVSLEQMWCVLSEKNQPVPEVFFWRLAADLCEAFKCILSSGLQYEHFGMDNVFVVHDRLVLENGLMRKRTKSQSLKTKVKRSQEQNVLCDIICILRCLILNNGDETSCSESLRSLITDAGNEKSLEDTLQKIKATVRNLNTFSFIDLIQSLQK